MTTDRIFAHAFTDLEANVVPICIVVSDDSEAWSRCQYQWCLQAAEEMALCEASGRELYSCFQCPRNQGRKRQEGERMLSLT